MHCPTCDNKLEPVLRESIKIRVQYCNYCNESVDIELAIIKLQERLERLKNR